MLQACLETKPILPSGGAKSDSSGGSSSSVGNGSGKNSSLILL